MTTTILFGLALYGQVYVAPHPSSPYPGVPLPAYTGPTHPWAEAAKARSRAFPVGPGWVAATARVPEVAAPASRAPGPATLVAAGPVTIRAEAGTLVFTWEGGDVPAPGPPDVDVTPPPPDPAPQPPPNPPPPSPQPPPNPPPPVPYPPARPAAWMTMVYDARAMSPGVAAIRASREAKVKLERMGVRWLMVDKQARLPDGRNYFQVTGLDRATTQTGVPAVVVQAADGTVLRARPVPADSAAALGMLADFLAMPAGSAEVRP